MDDKEQYTALLLRHRKLVWKLCSRYAKSDCDLCADLVQEVMLHLWRYRHTLRGDANEFQEKAWVWIRCRSVFEHQRRRPRVETVPMEEALHVITEDTSARDAIDRLSAKLTPLEHEVLELVLDGYTDSEIDSLLHLVPSEAGLLHTQIIDKMKRKAKE